MKLKFTYSHGMKSRSVLMASWLLVTACASSPPPANTTPAATAAPTSAAPQARPSCEAIDEACDPHEDKGGLAKECHDLAEAAATSEETCAARKAECLAACPK